MTGVLNVDTIADNAGTGPVTLTKQSAAKCWLNAPSGLASISGSFNVSSLDDDGTGDGGVNVTNNFDSANHAPVGTTKAASSVEVVAFDVSSIATSGWDFQTAGVSSTSDRTTRDRLTFTTSHGDLA